MLTFADKYKDNGPYSQFGEWGLIEEIRKRIGLISGTSVEFGAPTREYCSNTMHLPEDHWRKYFYDINPTDQNVIKKEINPGNINELPECNILSMDTDGPDLILWQAYTGTPDIVIIEINSSLPPDRDYYNFASGCSYKLMVETGIAKGYFIVCHTGNCIFLLNKYRSLFAEIEGDGLSNWPLYFNTAHL